MVDGRCRLGHVLAPLLQPLFVAFSGVIRHLDERDADQDEECDKDPIGMHEIHLDISMTKVSERDRRSIPFVLEIEVAQPSLPAETNYSKLSKKRITWVSCPLTGLAKYATG